MNGSLRRGEPDQVQRVVRVPADSDLSALGLPCARESTRRRGGVNAGAGGRRASQGAAANPIDAHTLSPFPIAARFCQPHGMSSPRIEKDSMGAMEVPGSALYGASTQRAVLNFP